MSEFDLAQFDGTYEVRAWTATTGHPIAEFRLSGGRCQFRWGPDFEERTTLKGDSTGSAVVDGEALVISLERSLGGGPANETIRIKLSDVDRDGLLGGEAVGLKIEYHADGERVGLQKMLVRREPAGVFAI